MTTNNTLRTLWNSTQNLLSRFGLKAQTDAQLRKVVEEVYEFAVEVNKPESWKLDSESELKEAADVIVTVLSVVQSRGWSFEDLERAVEAVVEKNAAKTHDTHEVMNGMIVRRKDIEIE